MATSIHEPSSSAAALRVLGRTGASVEAFSLGGEGILRTHGREAEAVPMVLEALRLGVRYVDTAPADASSPAWPTPEAPPRRSAQFRELRQQRALALRLLTPPAAGARATR